MVYNTPATDFNRSEVIRQPNETTLSTREDSLRGTVSFIDVSASGAGATGIAGVNRDHRDTSTPSFVFNFLAQIIKRPTRKHSALGLTSRDPRADVRQFFERNPALSALSLRYDLFADHMVSVVGEALFLSRQFLESSVCAERAFDLQLSPQATVTETNIVHGAGAVDFAVAVNRDVDDAQINAEKTFHVDQGVLWHVASRVKKPFTLAVDQNRLALLVCQERQMVRARCKPNCQSTAKRPDTYVSLINSPPENTVIVGDPSVRLKNSFGELIFLVGIYDFADTAYRHLCREFVFCTNGVVRRFVQTNLRELLRFPCDIAGEITRDICAFQCLHQVSMLFAGRQKFHNGSQFHTHSIAQNAEIFNQVKDNFG